MLYLQKRKEKKKKSPTSSARLELKQKKALSNSKIYKLPFTQTFNSNLELANTTFNYKCSKINNIFTLSLIRIQMYMFERNVAVHGLK